MGYIEKGIEEGAEVLCGGSNPFDQGYFVSPTVFADVNDEMTIAKKKFSVQLFLQYRLTILTK